MAAGAPRDTTAVVRFFARNPPPEALDKNGVHEFGEPNGSNTEQFRKQRHIVTEPFDVTILDATNANGGLDSWKLDTHGFCCVKNLPFPPPVDFTDEKKVEQEYYPKVFEMVKSMTGAKSGCMMGHLLRTEKSKTTGAYARFCHCDAGPDSPDVLWRRILVKRGGLPEEEVRDCDIEMVNVWHPFDHPAYKNPLCLLDATTVNYADKESPPHRWGDIVQFKYFNKGDNMKDRDRGRAEVEVRERARRGQGVAALGMGPLYTPGQRWVFYPDMPTDAAWVFKQYDTRDDVARASFHNSFYDPFHDSNPDTPGRRSFECRMLLTFPKKAPAAKL